MPRKSSARTDSDCSRRDFLKTSTVAAGALAGGLTIGRSAHAAGDDTLKIGLVGCGGRGTGAAVNAMRADPNVKLVAMADAFEDRLLNSLTGLKKQMPDKVAVDDDHRFVGFDGYQRICDDKDIDVVLLTTSPHFRPIQLEAAIAAGKHVFCEKPVAVDGPGFRSILATTAEAEKKKLSLVSGLCWRYHTGTQEVMRRVLDGAIGNVLAVQSTYNTGTLWHRGRKEDDTEMTYQMRNWYYFAWLSGDHNCEQHVHSLDKASWAMNDQPPVKAWGLGGRQVRTDPKWGDIYDHHAVVYQYESGARVYSFCRQQAGCKREVTDHFFGTKGHCDVLGGYQITGENPYKFRDTGTSPSMYDAEHVALFESIRSGKPINNGRYMAISTMLAVLGRMVNYTGQEITWEQAINSEQKLAPESYGWNVDPPTMPDENGRYPVAIPGVTKIV